MNTKKHKIEMNTPNTLTLLRIFLVPVFAVLILTPAGGRWGDLAAGIVFIVASLTDTLDGYLARKNNQVTTFGKFMDPLADKLLVCTALICLTDIQRLPSWVAIVIVAREFIISGFRLVAAEKGIVIAASYWGKFKTVFQMLMVILLVFNLGGWLDIVAQVFMWIAVVLTIVSLIDYIRKNISVLYDVH